MSIDPKRTLGIRGGNPDTPVKFVGLDPDNGNIVVKWGNSTTMFVFDKEGNGVGNSIGYSLINLPTTTRSFHWWDERQELCVGRGMISLAFVWSEYPDAKHALEIVKVDGQLSDIILHKKDN